MKEMIKTITHPDPESSICAARALLDELWGRYDEAAECPDERWLPQLAHLCDEVVERATAILQSVTPEKADSLF